MSRPRRQISTEPTRVIGYVRVSTEQQADSGISLEAQQKKLDLYSQLHELALVQTIVDSGVSAKTLERPGLQRALALLQDGEADGLLVAKLDRLTRSVRDLGQLIDRYFGERRGHALLSVSEQIDTRSAGGRLVLNVLASVSQWEREAIGERTQTALQYLRSKGRCVSRFAPYGFTKTPAGALERVEDEQAVIDEANRLRRQGLSLRAVARRLWDAGHRSRRGTPFGPGQVLQMVTARSAA